MRLDLAILLAAISNAHGAADPLSSWTPLDSPLAAPMKSAVYASGVYVAVGDYSAWSTNGTGWEPLTDARPAKEVVRGNGLFLALGDPASIFVSPTGRTWTRHFIGGVDNLNGLAFGSDVFVIAGDGGTILRSTTGSNWIRSESGTTKRLHGVRFMRGAFYAFGAGPTLLKSGDGVDWQSIDVPTSLGETVEIRDGTDSPFGLAFVGVSKGALLRNDGTWSITTLPCGIALQLRFGFGLFGAVMCGQLFTSLDFNTWTAHPTAGSVSAFFFSPESLFAFGTDANIRRSGRFDTNAPAVLKAELLPGVTITGDPGRRYIIQSAPATEGPWKDEAEILLPTSPHRWIDPAGLNPHRKFFRAVAR